MNVLKRLNNPKAIIMFLIVFVLGGIDGVNKGLDMGIEIPGWVIALAGMIGTMLSPSKPQEPAKQ